MNHKMWKYLSEVFWAVPIKPTRRFPRHSTIYVKNLLEDRELNVLEIGTLNAENSRNILKELNVKTLTIIDPYEEYEDYLVAENDKTKKFMEKCRKTAERRLKKWNNKLIWIRKKSSDAVSDIEDGSMDFIYIDGNHAYRYVLEDMNNYWDKVRVGGIFAGHDINSSGHEGVAKAFVEFCNKNKLTPIIHGQDWILEKLNDAKRGENE